MPSFDIVSEVDKQEIDNALNQARKELATRFDLKDAKTEIIPEPDKIILIADDGAHLKSLREIIQAIKSQGFKVQSQLQDRQIRITGKKKDELQTVIQFVRSRDFGVATNFKNFRD